MPLALSLLLLEAASAGSGAYRPYANARYGYAMCYPAFMHAMPESDNGDGRVFKSRDGGVIRVWGENNVLEKDLVAQSRFELKRGETVTYSVKRPNWIVQSGTGTSYIFWRKIYQRKDQFITADIEYPSSAKAKYDPVVKVVSSCFKLGQPGF